MTLWSGRMGTGPAEEMMAFSASISYDKRLLSDDVRASSAHVRGLGRAGVLSEVEVTALTEALSTVEREQASGELVLLASDEDVHSLIERRVTEICGPTGAKLHTGRSRNDQVATALRLYCRREIATVLLALLELQRALQARASHAGTLYLPGYTHLQRAQPVLLAHQLLAHGWALARDFDRLVETQARLSVSSLGAGALGGSTLALDPDAVAADLGFAARFENSIDAVADRDFVAETLFDLALLGIHLSRLGEEIVIYSSEEFGFYRLDDAWATGSSMLPQKKNPDIAELARGKAGRLVGHLVGFLTTLKGIPFAYNRDLQEDKEPLFDAFDQVLLALPAMSGLISSLTFVESRMREAADSPSLAAVDLAEFLVAKGMPFRQAHSLIGELVRQSLEEGRPLKALVESHSELGASGAALLEPGLSTKRRQSPGGGGESAVAVQLARYGERLERDQHRIQAAR